MTSKAFRHGYYAAWGMLAWGRLLALIYLQALYLAPTVCQAVLGIQLKTDQIPALREFLL